MDEEWTCWAGAVGQGLYPPLILSRIHRRQLSGDLVLRKTVSRYTFHFEKGNLQGCSTGTTDEGMSLREALGEVFSWGEGSYSFVKSPAGDGEGAGDSCSTPELILEGVRAIENLYLVEQALGRAEGVVHPGKNGLESLAFQLSPLESYLLSRLDGPSTVEELCQVSPITRPETLRGIYVLLCAGVVKGGGAPLHQKPATVGGEADGGSGGTVRSLADLGPTRPPAVVQPSFSQARQRSAPEKVFVGLPSNNSWREDAAAVYGESIAHPDASEIEKSDEPSKDMSTESAAPEEPLDMARYHFEKGLEHYANEDFYGAVQLFELAAKMDDLKAEYHRHLALALSRNPRWVRKAEKALIRAVKLEPDHAETHYFLGRIYLDSGLPARAMARFRESLRIDPDLKPARMELAVMNGAARNLDREPVSLDLLRRKRA